MTRRTTPPPVSLFPRGLQQLLHIFNFTAIVAAATTPCCIVLCAGRYNDGVLPPAEEPFTGTEPACGDLQLPQLYELCRQCVFPKQFNSFITHSHTHSLSHTLTNVLSWQQFCVIRALKMSTSCFCLHILSRSRMVFLPSPCIKLFLLTNN